MLKVCNIDFKELLQYDDKCFVRPGSKFREEFLRKWLIIPNSSTIVAQNSSGDIVGYGCRRPAFQAGNHLIGPLYADSYDVAHDIVVGLSQDIPDTNIMFDVW